MGVGEGGEGSSCSPRTGFLEGLKEFGRIEMVSRQTFSQVLRLVSSMVRGEEVATEVDMISVGRSGVSLTAEWRRRVAETADSTIQERKWSSLALTAARAIER